jgi:hypothetical protein
MKDFMTKTFRSGYGYSEDMTINELAYGIWQTFADVEETQIFDCEFWECMQDSLTQSEQDLLASIFTDMKHEIFEFIKKDLVPSMLKRTLPEWEQE